MIHVTDVKFFIRFFGLNDTILLACPQVLYLDSDTCDLNRIKMGQIKRSAIRVFFTNTKLAILALLPTLCSHIIAILFFN